MRNRFYEKTTALGCNISLSGEPFGWVGFNLFEPQWLFYTTEGAKDEVKIDFALAWNCELPGACIVGDHWTNSIDLSDCRDDLDATAADQVEYLRRHIEESLRAFRAMIPSPAPDS